MMIMMMMMTMTIMMMLMMIMIIAITTTIIIIIIIIMMMRRRRVVMMTMIMMALKGVIRDLLTASRTVSNTHAQAAKAQLCSNHMQHIRALITCNMSCATWYEGTAQLLSLTEFRSHLF